MDLDALVLKAEVFALLDAKILVGKKATGRHALDLWQILDLGVVRLGDLLRPNLSADDPELIWRCPMQLCFVEEAFRTLKGDLGLRPIFHQLPERIEAHLFIAFLASCLSITLRQQLRTVTGGLIPRVVLEKLATVQMLDVVVPTTDGRKLLLVRRTEPSRDVQLLLDHLNLPLPPHHPPAGATGVVVATFGRASASNQRLARFKPSHRGSRVAHGLLSAVRSDGFRGCTLRVLRVSTAFSGLKSRWRRDDFRPTVRLWVSTGCGRRLKRSRVPRVLPRRA